MYKQLITTAAVLVFLAGCSSSSMDDLGGTPSSTLNDGDNDWFKMITLSNLTEIQISQMAMTQSHNSAVKEFAQRMIDDHTKANDEVMQLAAEKQVILPTRLDSKHQAIVDDLKSKTGPDFDKEFEQVQVKAHKETIAFDQDEANNGVDLQVKAEAEKLLPILKMHLQLAEKLHNGASGM